MDARWDAISHYWDTRAPGFDRELSHGLHSDEQRVAWLDLLGRLAGPAPKRVLDVGCGTGFLSLLLAELGHRVTGIDLSAQMLEQARKKAAAANMPLTYRNENAASLSDPDETYDFVIGRHIVWTLPDPSRGVSEWLRVLRPGGRLALVEERWASTRKPRPPLTFKSKARAVLDAGFTVVSRGIGIRPRGLYARNYARVLAQLPFSGGPEPERLVELLEARGLRNVTFEMLADPALWCEVPQVKRYLVTGTR